MTSGEAAISLGTFAWFGYQLPLAERLNLIKRSGFSHTFLWMGSPEPLVESGRAHEMPGMVADAGLAVDHAHAIYENANAFWSDKPSERDALAPENTRATNHLDLILDEVPLESLGLCYDSSHDFLYSSIPCAVLEK